jgi:hypothetical protein
MDRIAPTPRNRILGLLADALSEIEEKAKTARQPNPVMMLPSLLGQSTPQTALLNLLGVPAVRKTLDDMSYGYPVTTGKGMTTKLKPEAAEAAMVVSGAAGPVARVGEKAAMAVGRAGERLAERAVPAVMERGGLPAEMMAAMGEGTRSRVYRESTPMKPDPSVGTRYEREFLGGLSEKTPLKLEDYEGSSVMIMPWDSTSRNYRITGISDEALQKPVVTHGGQDYARDIGHIEQGIAGASNLEIAKRIRDRDAQARIENLEAGGSGGILHLPVTMGAMSENFSVMPTEVLLNFFDRAALSAGDIKKFDDSIREFKVFKGTGEKRRETQPFKNFKGIMTDEGRVQIYTAEGLDGTAGELRKAIANRAYLKENQEKLGFNAEDISAALTDPALVGVPKGYVGNTVIMSTPEGMRLMPSANKTYNTDFTGQYQGTFGPSIPAEVLLANRFQQLGQEFANKQGDVRNMILGALEKRKEGISELVDQQMIDRYYDYLKKQRAAGLLD